MDGIPEKGQSLTESSYWMQIASNQEINIVAPDMDLVTIDDISEAGARVCRYAAQSRWYSVAAHAAAAALTAERLGLSNKVALGTLMHDAVESYLGDTIGPLRRYIRNWCRQILPTPEAGDGPLELLHRRWNQLFAEKFGYPDPDFHKDIKILDQVALAVEVPRVFTRPSPFWERMGIIPAGVEETQTGSIMANQVDAVMAIEADGHPNGRQAIAAVFRGLFKRYSSEESP